jgi:hypothetical protein
MPVNGIYSGCQKLARFIALDRFAGISPTPRRTQQVSKRRESTRAAQ